MKQDSRLVLIDARSAQEFERINIRGAKNIPAPDLRQRHSELQKNKSIVIICSTGMRSSLAASILQSRGFQDVKNVAGGIAGYAAAGFIA
jgi:hydroxyacylglutathione hydrolase